MAESISLSRLIELAEAYPEMLKRYRRMLQYHEQCRKVYCDASGLIGEWADSDNNEVNGSLAAEPGITSPASLPLLGSLAWAR